ncbi:unnamed protein product [Dovyalis caffra]|uniref:Uncharacterized protein n=1 Tax=Dovyalis caffra TaxID=77055 RepID=A0AAV1RDA5_9ROSI|nr:unnamed protein product [Dovyalis caffra]
MKQTGTIASTGARFEMLAVAAGKIEEATMTVVFINGSEEKIKAELFMLNLVGLKETMPSSLRTPKMNGVVEGSEVVVLIDPSVTHNFISLVLVEKLGLPISATPNYGVVIGNGSRLKGEGILASHIGGYGSRLEEAFYESTMNGRRIELIGDPSPNHALVSFKALVKTMQLEDEGVLLELHHLIVSEENIPDIRDITISEVLDRF